MKVPRIKKYTKKETSNNNLELKKLNHLSKTKGLWWAGAWEGLKQKHSKGFVTWKESKEEVVIEVFFKLTCMMGGEGQWSNRTPLVSSFQGILGKYLIFYESWEKAGNNDEM